MNETIFDKVRTGGYCIGCAACTAVTHSPIRMKFQENGTYQAEIDTDTHDNNIEEIMSVCPFSGLGKNENELGAELYPASKEQDEYLGHYDVNYAGYVEEGTYRSQGSSGGMATWILTELFKTNQVDKIIHVKENDKDILFKFGISDHIKEIQKSAKSRYYPVEMSEVLKFVKENPGRYAIIGLPCFIKSIRLLSDKEPIFKERIKYCVGLVCGHLKSSYFAEMMALQMGYKKNEILTINFREKLEGRNAGDYGAKVTGIKNGEMKEILKPTRELFGTNWGHGFFKYNACEYCDDVLAETADITIGDAWLPEYIEDSKGTNIVVIRHKKIHELVKVAMNEGRLIFDEISAEKIYESQAGGFRHRREGLAFRLKIKESCSEWVPTKRVISKGEISKKRALIYKGRIEIKNASFINFHKIRNNNHNINDFISQMSPIIKKYNRIEQLTVFERILKKGIKLIIRG